MSISVENLTKLYGTQRALDGISFSARKGEILGFLGPNGAGKTTTMKILTGFVPQTSGRATVCGFDTSSQSMDVRRRIGYLPEHNPLYKNQYVREYLQFVARLYHVPNAPKKVEEMIARTGLGPEAHKQIGMLSKGYRQRVGLAQAMLHDPEVLILDEPTSGLDPNQLADIRALIRELGSEKTVLFSTHIMQEVEALCHRVVIINKGRIVADDSIEHLQGRVAGETLVTVEFAAPVELKLLRQIKGVQRVEQLGEHRYRLAAPKGTDVRVGVNEFSVAHRVALLEMQREEQSIAEIFQLLTKEASGSAR